MPAEQPYLSIVVTSRNDNHGGDLNRRTQTFINSVAEQCQRHKLRAELIFVEWNPPEDRGPLSAELEWPECGGWCTYRMVTVPRDVHLNLACRDKLPLYQMLAKNVGIRRASGKFICATNVDLIFSNELTKWLASGSLKQGYYYRTDRFDVPMDVMGLSDAEEQLAYCRNNLLRVHTKYGTVDGEKWSTAPLPGFAFTQVMWQRIRLALSDHRAAAQAKGPRKSMLARLGNIALDFSIRNAARYTRKFGRLGYRATRRSMNLGRRFSIHYAKESLKAAGSGARFVVDPRQWRRANTLGLKRRLRGWSNPLNRMHTNGCGDFTLMSREDWDRLGGYAELEIFSWHLDSLLVFAAFHSGMLECVVPHHLYHIEHRGGWTPESAEALWERLKAKGIPFLTNEDLDKLHVRIRETSGVYEFNDADWGMSKLDLTDEHIPANATSPAANQQNMTRAA